MFKFFREYNKYLLGIGMTLLMIAFLIQPTLNIFAPSEEKRPLGTMNGRKVIFADQRRANSEVEVIKAIARGSGMLLPTPDSGLKWMLMLEDARQMGLQVSDVELQMLRMSLGLGNAQNLAQLSQSLGASPVFIDQALRHWLLSQTYQQVVLGLAEVPVEQRIQNYRQAAAALLQAQQIRQEVMALGAEEQQMLGQIYQMQYFQSLQVADNWAALALGQPRVSPTLMQRFMQDQQGQVQIALVPVSYTRTMEQVPAPTAEQLVELFHAYRNDLPGEGKPYGFGYRYPDRVRMEYLEIPFARLMSRAVVGEADALDYYNKHQDQFPVEAAVGATTAPAPEAPKVKPYLQVRPQIMEQLRREAAHKLGQQVVKAIQARIADAERTLLVKDGVKQVPADWKGPNLEQIAGEVAKDARLGVMANYVHRAGWATLTELAGLDGIGDAELPMERGQPASLAEYVRSARELGHHQDNRLAPLSLQMGLASLPMESPDGSVYLFRLTAVEPAHSPELVDGAIPAEIEPVVRKHFVQRAAYQLLVAQRQQLADQAATTPLEELAKTMTATQMVQKPSPFARRDVRRGMEVPEVQGVGKSKLFVDRVFELADALSDPADASSTPLSLRTDAIAVDEKLTVFLVRVDAYRAMPRSTYLEIAADPQAPLYVSRLLQTQMGKGTDPLSIEQLKSRVKFVMAGERRNDDADAETTSSAPAPGTGTPAAP